MVKMYIANCTNYKQSFLYRLPEQKQPYPFELDLPMRGQAALPHDLPMDILQGIIEAHEPYGLVEDKQVHNVKGFNGLIYRIGAPVDMERVEHVAEKNLEHLTEGVQDRMKQQLAAANHAVKTELGEDAAVDQLEVIEVTDPNNPDKKQAGMRKGAVMAGKSEKRGGR